MIILLVIFTENCHFEIKIAFLLLKFAKKVFSTLKKGRFGAEIGRLVPKLDVFEHKIVVFELKMTFLPVLMSDDAIDRKFLIPQSPREINHSRR